MSLSGLLDDRPHPVAEDGRDHLRGRTERVEEVGHHRDEGPVRPERILRVTFEDLIDDEVPCKQWTGTISQAQRKLP